MPINAEWHRAHPMPKRPTVAQRIDWHLEHARECACRPITGKLAELIAKERGRSALSGKTATAQPRVKAPGKARKRTAKPRGA